VVWSETLIPSDSLKKKTCDYSGDLKLVCKELMDGYNEFPILFPCHVCVCARDLLCGGLIVEFVSEVSLVIVSISLFCCIFFLSLFSVPRLHSFVSAFLSSSDGLFV